MACLPKDTLRCGGAFISVTANVVIFRNTLISRVRIHTPGYVDSE